MKPKKLIFQLFRYQLLPINRYLDENFPTNLFSDITTVEELIKNKNKLFKNALETTDGSSNRFHETITKKLFSEDDFYIFRIAKNRSLSRETKEFKTEEIDSWPSLLVAIWNHPDKQLIAVQRRSSAIPAESAVKLILETLSNELELHQLRCIPESLFNKEEFWAILKAHKEDISFIEFELITDNMASISKKLTNGVKDFAKLTNATRTYYKIESDPQSSLHLNEENKVLNGMVDYASEGGGNAIIKFKNLKKKYQTSKSSKTIEIEELEYEGNPEQLADLFKRILP